MVLWELCERTATGVYSAPFKEFPYIMIDIQIIIQASQKQLRPTIHEDVPDSFADIIRRCWDPDPKVRPEAAELLEELEEFPRRKPGDGLLSPTNAIIPSYVQ